MEDFTKLDCGCYVGFDVYHKPMWGKQCPLHEASGAMYEALKEVRNYSGIHSIRVDDLIYKALALADRR